MDSELGSDGQQLLLHTDVTRAHNIDKSIQMGQNRSGERISSSLKPTTKRKDKLRNRKKAFSKRINVAPQSQPPSGSNEQLHDAAINKPKNVPFVAQ